MMAPQPLADTPRTKDGMLGRTQSLSLIRWQLVMSPMARKVAAAFGGSLRGKTVALLGLTFKPNTDDMRDAPSIALVTALQDMGAKVRAYDPVGMEQARTVLTDVTYCDDSYSCAQDADALVIVTEWEQFRALDLHRLKKIMACPVLIDLRNIYIPQDVAQHGFIYDSVGRPSRMSTTQLPSMPGQGGPQIDRLERDPEQLLL